MKFAIRDDDTCFFTSPHEIESAYDFLSSDDVLSISIVPYSVPLHKRNHKPYGDHEYKEYNIEENIELIKYICKGVKKGTLDPLLHGYSHEYLEVSGKWVPEMKWKDLDRLENEISMGKELLERLFSSKIKVFIPPSNHIDRKGISVLEKNNLDLSGIIIINDRSITLRYIRNFIIRWLYRAIYGIQYGGVLDYGAHKELCAYALDSKERLIKEYLHCKKRNFPFVVYTHYWFLNQNIEEKRKLKFIYDYAKNDGAKMVALSDLIK